MSRYCSCSRVGCQKKVTYFGATSIPEVSAEMNLEQINAFIFLFMKMVAFG